MNQSPIADLSYRHYEGVLDPPSQRWWVVAKMGMRLAFKKKSLWVAMAFSGWYYLGMIFVLFIMEVLGGNASQAASATGINPSEQYIMRIVWKDQFVHGVSFGQMMFLVMALILGSGSIANDSRANALLVYLSKPVTKFDYLFGKWFGIFLPLYVVMLVPSIIFFLYGALSFRDYGFISQDPYLFWKLMLALPLGAGLHASLIVGFSSLFNQGRLAGATYAAVYFLTNFFTQLMVGTWISMTQGSDDNRNPMLGIVANLFYASVDGINIGLTKAILGTDGSPWFGVPSDNQMVPAPSVFPMLLIALGISFISTLIAWKRVRAVEVVS